VASLTDRHSARERILAAFSAQLDRLIPPDQTVPLRGGLFIDWEVQADELARTVGATFVEERAALDESASVSVPGRCPRCGSDRVYLIPGTIRRELLTPHGPVVLQRQRCRCRSCDRTFSPSAARVGTASDRGAEPDGGKADRP
jgi:hypothetical protein